MAMSNHSREPIPHTCPDIDKVIKALQRIHNLSKLGKYEYTNQELTDIISDINYEVYGLDDKLEELRASNNSLRQWGISEAEYVDELEEKIQI